MSANRHKFKRIPIPKANVRLGDPFNGWMSRLPKDIEKPKHVTQDDLVYYEGIGWGLKRLTEVPQGEGLAVFTGCDLRIFADHVRDRASGLYVFHLSIRFPDREPTWSEMNAIRNAFYPDDVDVIQVHPKIKKYVNVAQWVWHLWQFPGDWDISSV